MDSNKRRILLGSNNLDRRSRTRSVNRSLRVMSNRVEHGAASRSRVTRYSVGSLVKVNRKRKAKKKESVLKQNAPLIPGGFSLSAQ